LDRIEDNLTLIDDGGGNEPLTALTIARIAAFDDFCDERCLYGARLVSEGSCAEKDKPDEHDE
jgi:hypothetical protein